MIFFTSSASSVVDEKTAPLTGPCTNFASHLSTQMDKLRNTAVKRVRRSVGRLTRPRDDTVLEELSAWGKGGEIHGQLTNIFLKHLRGTDVGYKPQVQTVNGKELSTKVRLRDVLNVIDQTTGTKLGEDLAALDDYAAGWKKSYASACSGNEVPKTHWPWATHVTPLLGKTRKAIQEINRKDDQKSTNASTNGGQESQFQDQFIGGSSDKQGTLELA